MTNDRPVYILPLVNYNTFWPIIDHLYCMTSFLLGIASCQFTQLRHGDDAILIMYIGI